MQLSIMLKAITYRLNTGRDKHRYSQTFNVYSAYD